MTLSRVLFVCIFAGFGHLLSGCNQGDHRFSNQRKILQEYEALGNSYLKSDLVPARNSLLKAAKLIEQATILEPDGRAQWLCHTYLRLYVLESRSGDEAAAEAALTKARYWYVVRDELNGKPPLQTMAGIKDLTDERIFQYITDFDRKHSEDGKEAHYLEELKPKLPENRVKP